MTPKTVQIIDVAPCLLLRVSGRVLTAEDTADLGDRTQVIQAGSESIFPLV